MYNLVQDEQISLLFSRDLYLSKTIELFSLDQMEELSYIDHNLQKQTACVIKLCEENMNRAHSQI